MSISDIQKEIYTVESNIYLATVELHKVKNVSTGAFSGNDNWREKDSIGKRIPVLEKKISDLNCVLSSLISKKATLFKEIEYSKAIEAQKKKDEEAKVLDEEAKVLLVGPIAQLEIE